MCLLLQRSARNLIALASLTAVLTLASSAAAEERQGVETTTQGDLYGYKFKDESLLGSTIAPGGDMFTSRRGFHRVLLLRPRTDLIPQLFKSVENL